MAKGAGVTPFTRPISWCAGLELTSLSGAEAEGRTGPLGALWGGERPFRRRCTSRKNSPPPVLQTDPQLLARLACRPQLRAGGPQGARLPARTALQ